MYQLSHRPNRYSHQRSNTSICKSNNHFSFFQPIIQPKAGINQRHDVYELEADAIAEKVMRMHGIETEPLFFQPKLLPVTTVLRKCAHCEDEEKVQVKGDSSTPGGITAPSKVNDVISSGGQPLDARTRSFMESRFGYNFGDVQVHDDSLANQSASDINALAYTHENHVVFGAEQYRPDTNRGKQLLAHELTHVLQQEGTTLVLQRQRDSGEPLVELPEDLSGPPKGLTPAKGCIPQGVSRTDFVKYFTAAGMYQDAKTSYGLTVLDTGKATLPGANIVERGKNDFVFNVTDSFLPDIPSFYVNEQNYQEGVDKGGTASVCKKTKFPVLYLLSPATIATFKAAEKEHCNDYNYAFDISIKRYRDAVNNLANPPAKKFKSKGQIKAALKKKTGVPPEKWADVFTCLNKKTKLRDTNGWHKPVEIITAANQFRPGNPYYCENKTIELKPLTQIDKKLPSEIIKDCGEKL